MSRKHSISPLLILILLVAWALLTIQIGAAWFGHQDANGAWISVALRNDQLHGWRGGLIDIQTDPLGAAIPYTHHPPLAVWISALPVLLLGYSEALLRFVMAACTLIGTAALYVLARRLAGQTLALWSAAFYAFTPMIAYFGRMPDHEAPALMICLLFAAVLVNWLRRPTRGEWWALVALTVLAVWTAWAALIVIALLTLMGLIFTRRRAALILLLVAALGALIALLGDDLLLFPDAISDLINAFVWRTSTSSLEAGTVAFTWGDYALRIAVRLITLYTPSLLALVLIGAGLLWRRRGRLRAVVIALLLAALGYALLFRNASYIHDYYLIYLAPALALLAGSALALLPRRSRWLRPLVASLALVTLPATLFYLHEIYATSDSALGLDFAQVVRDQTAPGDLILSNLPSIGDALEFYAERAIHWSVPPADALQAASASSRATYYLHCDNYSALPQDAPRRAEVEINPQCRLTRLR